MEMTQSLHRALQQEPDRASTVFGDRQRTVAETADRVARLAGALVELGVRPGDRVGLLALNSDRYLEYLLAVPWSGAAVNPVNIRWSPAEIAYSLVDCDTRVLLVDDALQPASDATVEDLQAFCRDLIANYKLPRSVAFVDELPMSGAGKILKRELRQQHRSHP